MLAEPGEAEGDAWALEDGDAAGRGFAELESLVRSGDAPWVGVLGYDVAYGLERIGTLAARDHAWPAAAMRRCPGWLLHDRIEGRWWAGGAWADSSGWVADLPSRKAEPAASRFGVGPLRSDLSEAAYRAKVQRCLAYIAAGDVFQVNLTQRFGGAFVGDPRGMWLALGEGSPAWYGAFVEWPACAARPALSLASISPELLFELRGDGAVVTRPIKGTRPSSAPDGELLGSSKDAAELAMIVDLLRNDLGRVCAYGSVRVDEARAIEHHPTVQHGVATVSGRLHGSRGLADLLRAILPGGSITGAPKVRAMQIVDELEPVRRGPYCGAIGWLQRDDTAAGGPGVAGAFNVAIRTVLVEQAARLGRGRLSFGVGGGIVADSDPQAEFDETLVKSAAVRAGLATGRLPIDGSPCPFDPSTPVHLVESSREASA